MLFLIIISFLKILDHNTPPTPLHTHPKNSCLFNMSLLIQKSFNLTTPYLLLSIYPQQAISKLLLLILFNNFST